MSFYHILSNVISLYIQKSFQGRISRSSMTQPSPSCLLDIGIGVARRMCCPCMSRSSRVRIRRTWRSGSALSRSSSVASSDSGWVAETCSCVNLNIPNVLDKACETAIDKGVCVALSMPFDSEVCTLECFDIDVGWF